MQNIFVDLGSVRIAAEKVDELETQCRKDLKLLIGDKMPIDPSAKEIDYFVKRGFLSREKGEKALDLLVQIEGLMEVHGQLIQADNALFLMGF